MLCSTSATDCCSSAIFLFSADFAAEAVRGLPRLRPDPGEARVPLLELGGLLFAPLEAGVLLPFALPPEAEAADAGGRPLLAFCGVAEVASSLWASRGILGWDGDTVRPRSGSVG